MAEPKSTANQRLTQIKDFLTMNKTATTIPWDPNCTKFPTRKELPQIPGAPPEAAWVWGDNDYVSDELVYSEEFEKLWTFRKGLKGLYHTCTMLMYLKVVVLSFLQAPHYTHYLLHDFLVNFSDTIVDWPNKSSDARSCGSRSKRD